MKSQTSFSFCYAFTSAAEVAVSQLYSAMGPLAGAGLIRFNVITDTSTAYSQYLPGNTQLDEGESRIVVARLAVHCDRAPFLPDQRPQENTTEIWQCQCLTLMDIHIRRPAIWSLPPVLASSLGSHSSWLHKTMTYEQTRSQPSLPPIRQIFPGKYISTHYVRSYFDSSKILPDLFLSTPPHGGQDNTETRRLMDPVRPTHTSMSYR